MESNELLVGYCTLAWVQRHKTTHTIIVASGLVASDNRASNFLHHDDDTAADC
jgi:hypothetical protein